MKAEARIEQDAGLSALLRECKITVTLPPRFQEGVWRQIARQEDEPSTLVALWLTCARWVDARLRRPGLAVSYVAVLLVIGGSAGWAQAQQERLRVSTQMSQRYVQSVDPYQAVK
jgi:hypothetical protein